MISFLSGKPIIQGQNLTILVSGVGYLVHTSAQDLAQIRTKEMIEVFIYTHVREDTLALYGFLTAQQSDLFKLVLGVSGVGPNTALHLVSKGSIPLIEAVQNAQVAFFTAFPRVGKKLAQKIIIELRGKLGELKSLELGSQSEQYLQADQALEELGFDEQSRANLLDSIDIEHLKIEQILKLALKKSKL